MSTEGKLVRHWLGCSSWSFLSVNSFASEEFIAFRLLHWIMKPTTAAKYLTVSLMRICECIPQIPLNVFTSVQFSCSVVSNSLRPHESQHASPPCPSPTPGVHSDSCPSSQWCHPALSSSVIPFSSCPQSLPASEAFPMSQLFTWGGLNIGVSASASVLPVKVSENVIGGFVFCFFSHFILFYFYFTILYLFCLNELD